MGFLNIADCCNRQGSAATGTHTDLLKAILEADGLIARNRRN